MTKVTGTEPVGGNATNRSKGPTENAGQQMPRHDLEIYMHAGMHCVFQHAKYGPGPTRRFTIEMAAPIPSV